VNEIVDEIYNCQYDNDINVNYTKIKAHSGEYGNTKADRLAKNGMKGASMDGFMIKFKLMTARSSI